MESDRTGVIVVGVDGSEASRKALAWSVGQALRVGARLRLVTAWTFPKPFGYEIGFEDWRPDEAAGQLQRRAFDSVGEDGATLVVDTKLVEGEPARVLVDETREAEVELLVVGSRGHRELAGMLLGSVSQYCAAHGECPVVIVHGDES